MNPSDDDGWSAGWCGAGIRSSVGGTVGWCSGREARGGLVTRLPSVGTVVVGNGGSMVDDVAWSPPRRRNGIWWIVASGLLLPAGWVMWLLVALAGYNGAGNSTHTLSNQTIGSIVVTVVCAGVPLAGWSCCWCSGGGTGR